MNDGDGHGLSHIAPSLISHRNHCFPLSLSPPVTDHSLMTPKLTKTTEREDDSILHSLSIFVVMEYAAEVELFERICHAGKFSENETIWQLVSQWCKLPLIYVFRVDGMWQLMKR